MYSQLKSIISMLYFSGEKTCFYLQHFSGKLGMVQITINGDSYIGVMGVGIIVGVHVSLLGLREYSGVMKC